MKLKRPWGRVPALPRPRQPPPRMLQLPLDLSPAPAANPSAAVAAPAAAVALAAAASAAGGCAAAADGAAAAAAAAAAALVATSAQPPAPPLRAAAAAQPERQARVPGRHAACHTVTRSRCHTIACHTVTLSHGHPVTLSPVTLSHCHRAVGKAPAVAKAPVPPPSLEPGSVEPRVPLWPPDRRLFPGQGLSRRSLQQRQATCLQMGRRHGEMAEGQPSRSDGPCSRTCICAQPCALTYMHAQLYTHGHAGVPMRAYPCGRACKHANAPCA
eukprot:354139-Chlamydomonas_euryale.AAC.1